MGVRELGFQGGGVVILKEGDRVTMCVRQAFVGGIRRGVIVPDFGADGSMDYFDLYNESGVLACMDGETCTVRSCGKDGVMLENAEGEVPVRFFLKWDEFDQYCSPRIGGSRG